MLSFPKPLDEIQRNLAFELLTYMGHATTLFPLSLWSVEVSKNQLSLGFNYKFNVQDFYTKPRVCSHK